MTTSTTDAEAIARKAVTRIIDDLTDRRGLRHAWDGIDDNIRAEIESTWTMIIRTSLASRREAQEPVDPSEQAYADLIASGGIFPEVYQQETSPMTDDQIKHMVDRFLQWKLPDHFSPDCGISFDQKYRSQHGPIGTNLLDATQATAMVRHMIDGLPTAPPAPAGEVERLVKPIIDRLEWNGRLQQWVVRPDLPAGTIKAVRAALNGGREKGK